MPQHKTTLVSVGDRKGEIDKKIAPLIETLWKLEIDTCNSCEDNNGVVWIEFFTANDAEQFFNIVAKFSHSIKSMYNRLRQGWDSGDTSDFWEYNAHVSDFGVDSEVDETDTYVTETFTGEHQFCVHVSVRFPKKDLKTVTKRVVAAYNDLAKITPIKIKQSLNEEVSDEINKLLSLKTIYDRHKPIADETVYDQSVRLGKIAYEGFKIKLYGFSSNDWDSLSDNEKHAWIEAGTDRKSVV